MSDGKGSDGKDDTAPPAGPSELTRRVLTAGVLVPMVVGGVLFADPLYFALFMGAFVVLGAVEWGRLAGFALATRAAYAAGTAALLALCYYGGGAVALLLSALAVPFWWRAATWVWGYERTGAGPQLTAPARGLCGWLLLVPTWCGIVAIRGGEHGPATLLFLLVLVWAADIAAYFAGRRFGRHKLSPRVSPGKSWEGAAGAMLVAALLVPVWILFRGEPWGHAPPVLLMFWATVAVSILGDLAESLFKRQAGVKDSGTLLPGHGGVLDRVDSLTAAVPFFLLLLRGIEYHL
jgi:phosphatidate cytidylyltransferase